MRTPGIPTSTGPALVPCAPTARPLALGALALIGLSEVSTAETEDIAAGDAPSLALSAAYSGDLRRNTTGGLAVGTAYADALDLGLVWVTDGLLPEARMTTNVSVMYLGGDDISGRYVGDLQYVNNLEASNGWKLYESWVDIAFGDRGPSLRAGVLDLNAEFDTPVTQGLFTASPFGIGTELSQTGERGPVCWPNTGLGLRAAGRLAGATTWRLGAYDAAPGNDSDDFTSLHLSGDEGALLIGELEYSSARFHKLAVGAWQYTSEFERIDAPMHASSPRNTGNRGFYAHLDARLGVLAGAEVDGAVRAGIADPRFNAVGQLLNVALTASIPSRPGDSLGLGLAWARLGDEYRALRSFEGRPATSAETTVELVYRAELTPWLALLPNMQFVSAPGADRAVDDSWVAGLRFELSRDRTWRLQARSDRRPDDSYAHTQR